MLSSSLTVLAFASSALAAPWNWPSWKHDWPSWAQPQNPHNAPYARVKNGTYMGVHSAEYNEDYFLGIPYAKAPVGDLRLRQPQSLDAKWQGVHEATEYSDACYGYGSDQWGYNVSEDCLYLNVIRPAGYEHQQLPVGFWIHGGGYVEGSGVDRRYNMSFIVQNSVKIGKPMIGVSINYRLSAFGFMYGSEIQKQGVTNLGLRDQRLAMHWVQENIAGFGGDPSKVTIWGESAGAGSVGAHLIAYGGRDDKIFRAAILESGSPVGPGFSVQNISYWDKQYNAVLNSTGCLSSSDSLSCLRSLSISAFNAAINTTTSPLTGWAPTQDGDLLQDKGSLQLRAGKFVHVPILYGANSDEGSAFGPPSTNTTQDFYNELTKTFPAPAPVLLNDSFAQQVEAAYPDDPSQEVIQELGPNARFGPPYGPQYRRSASYFGDVAMVAPRRFTCQQWAAKGVPAYCYRFNTLATSSDAPLAQPVEIGVTHFVEVSFVFLNFLGTGYGAPISPVPFTGVGENTRNVARLVSSSWASFINSLDPNAYRGGDQGVPAWPVYSVDAPQDFVFDANVTSHPEPDTYRAAGMALINDNAATVYGR